MSLKAIVKLNSVNNLSDARYAAGMGVNLIGINSDPGNEFYLSPEKFREISGWISGPAAVLEYSGNSLTEVKDLLKQYQLEWVEVTDQDLIPALSRENLKIIFKCTEIDTSSPVNPRDIQFVHLHSLSTISDQQIKKISCEYPVLLYTAIAVKDLRANIEATGIRGITISGGQEIKPGLKDYDLISDILEMLTEDD
jgi:phosphoribosylanthranilate isomerase